MGNIIMFQVTRAPPGLQEAFFDQDDSFSDLDCSQLEEQAIQASQALDVRRNLEKDIFGTDDEEDEEMMRKNWKLLL